MRNLPIVAVAGLLLVFATPGWSAKITGEYLEARTCSVYVGPCFANAEMNACGKEALMAWRVDKGTWNGVTLDGLGAALIVAADNTLGYDGIFEMKPGKMTSEIVIDERASSEQRAALIDFVKDTAKAYTTNVVKVRIAPISLTNDHLTKQAHFSAGGIAEIKTRGLKKTDCVCTNEVIYYLPLTKVENYSPAFSLKMSYQGKSLGRRFTNYGMSSAFLATFRR